MVEPLRRLTGGQRVVLVPVPLSRKRLRRRGFNQSRLLAEHLGLVVGIPCVDALVRHPERFSQAGSGRSERKDNVSGAFHWGHQPKVDLPLAILVDDVLTTGWTAAACSEAIREAGYSCGGVVTFSRALPRIAVV